MTALRPLAKISGIVEAGIDPAAKNRSNRTALWVATERRQLEESEPGFREGSPGDSRG